MLRSEVDYWKGLYCFSSLNILSVMELEAASFTIFDDLLWNPFYFFIFICFTFKVLESLSGFFATEVNKLKGSSTQKKNKTKDGAIK